MEHNFYFYQYALFGKCRFFIEIHLRRKQSFRHRNRRYTSSAARRTADRGDGTITLVCIIVSRLEVLILTGELNSGGKLNATHSLKIPGEQAGSERGSPTA
jgi:hypothetical protein